MTTAFLYDEQFLRHDAGTGHPESGERLTATLAHLEKQPWFRHLLRCEPRVAELDWIQKIHSLPYIRHAQSACRQGLSYLDSLDVGIGAESFDIALLAAGGALTLGDLVISGEAQNGFALIRPPGHHAEKNQAMGFCLFNNIAILARYLQERHGIEKVLILDWDVHHGNGTQHSFYEDPSVHYISLHQFPFYPGTGSEAETGEGKGRGATLNCPMPAGAHDADYEKVFQTKVLPHIDKFKPQIILISAGFDAHTQDPLAQICLSTECYGWMSERVMEAADKHADGKIVSLLEGGYDLEALPRSVAKHVAVLSGNN